MIEDREAAVTRAFVSVVTAMADGLDPVDLLSGLTSDCARLLDIASAGLLLADEGGVLHVLAASSESTRSLELFQLQREQGPCLECFRTGSPVSVPDLDAQSERWPHFVLAARAVGLVSVHAVPIRLRDKVLGALGLFGSSRGALQAPDVELAQALAHVAAVALVQDQVVSDATRLNEQLQTALNSRVALEQAKGVLAQHAEVDMDEAFAMLRRFARDRNYRLSTVAQAVTSRQLPPQMVLEHWAVRAGRGR